MKRSDIKVGDVLHYDTSPDWATPTWGSGSGQRATVISLWWVPGYLRSESGRDVPAGTKGAKILIELELDGHSYRRACLPQHLRGPYEQVLRDIAAYIETRDAQRADEKRRADEHTNKIAAVLAAARTIGVSADYVYGGGHRPRVEVRVEHLTAMIAALREAGWRYQP